VVCAKCDSRGNKIDVRSNWKEQPTQQRRRMVLAACVLASSMAFVDGSALTVAMPKLRAHFAADVPSVQWVLNGYLLALASLTLIWGALADVYGKARVLAVGCCCFGWRRPDVRWRRRPPG
jgi:hypothetical protein